VFEFGKEGVVIFYDLLVDCHDNFNNNRRSKFDNDNCGSLR
jgi:hypothetical protein